MQLIGCVTLSKLITFLYWIFSSENGANHRTYFIETLWGLNDWVYVKCLEQGSAYSKHLINMSHDPFSLLFLLLFTRRYYSMFWQGWENDEVGYMKSAIFPFRGMYQFVHFYCWVVFHCMNVPQFVYPFISCEIFVVFIFGNYESSYFLYIFWIFEFYFIFLYSRFLLVIHLMYINVYMSIPISQFITPPPPPPRRFSPLVSICLFSTSLSLFLLCKLVHLYHFSSSTYMR